MKYTVGGYRIAILARTAKTILVEGVTDKELLDSLKTNWGVTSNIVIDTHEIIDDLAFTGLGAKACVDTFISSVPQGSPISSKFHGLVDREWEDLIDPITLDPVPWSNPIQTNLRLRTLGHSIENYALSAQFVEQYLQHFGREVATPQVITDVTAAIPSILRAAAAFSEVARKRYLIKKCSDVVGLADVSWNGSHVVISNAVEQRLISRQAPNAVGFLQDFDTLYKGTWSGHPLSSEAHFHAHGHIGDRILWISVARIVENHGFSTDIAHDVAFGRRDEKRRVCYKWLSTLTRSALSPLDQALS